MSKHLPLSLVLLPSAGCAPELSAEFALDWAGHHEAFTVVEPHDVDCFLPEEPSVYIETPESDVLVTIGVDAGRSGRATIFVQGWWSWWPVVGPYDSAILIADGCEVDAGDDSGNLVCDHVPFVLVDGEPPGTLDLTLSWTCAEPSVGML
jgi:hypothetical protein